MGQGIRALQNGEWLTRERAQLWAFGLLAASVIGILFLLLTSDGLNDYQGRPLGTDFSNVYAAGTYVLEGRPEAPFDWEAQYAREQAIFGQATPFYGWHYPPFFLFIAAALAWMPYLVALAVWQGVTLLLYLGALREIFRSSLPTKAEVRDPLWIVIALAFPAVFVNFGHGHNGFLTAALLGTALPVLDRRPLLAGVLFGLIAYKPQFGVLIPLVLMATGRWRAFAAAAATVAVLVLTTLIAFGPDVWRAFFASTTLTRVEVLEQGGTGWHKIQSVFSAVRMWSGSVPLAYAAQASVTVTLGAAVIWIWRSAATYPLKAAALCIASILATPYSLDYDLLALAPAIAFLAAEGITRGFAPYEKSALAFLWLVPAFTRSVAEYLFVPIGLFAMLAMFALLLRRATGPASSANWHSAPEPDK
jgi:alpha-1,2-mannosyltransferase